MIRNSKFLILIALLTLTACGVGADNNSESDNQNDSNIDGIQLLQGPQGEKGEAGIQGEAGAAGTDGTSFIPGSLNFKDFVAAMNLDKDTSIDLKGHSLTVTDMVDANNPVKKNALTVQSGNVGIGKINPVAQLDVNADGKIRFTGTAPTVENCGGTPFITGSDVAGVVQVLSSPPTGSCTVRFHTPYPKDHNFACSITSNDPSAGQLGLVESPNWEYFQVSSSTGYIGRFTYYCFMIN